MRHTERRKRRRSWDGNERFATPARRRSGAALIEFADGFAVLLVVGGGEVEVDAAEGAFGFGLAENDGDLFIEGDAVAEVGTAILVGFNRFFHQGDEGAFAFLGGFIEAHDELFKRLQGFSNFRLKGVNRHGGDSYFGIVKRQVYQRVGGGGG